MERISWTVHTLRIEWSDGRVGVYTAEWLRDNLPGDRDPHSGQRLTDVADLPGDPRIGSARVGDGVVTVQWADELSPATFDAAWLAGYADGAFSATPDRRRRWLTGADLDARHDFAWGGLDALRDDRKAHGAWLQRLLVDGLAFLGDVPATDEAILEVAALIGRVAETNYGEVFDVRSVAQPENLAYSDLGLGLHTDNPYREPVPGFQILHVLSASPEGGDSLFADGIALAEHLRDVAPEAFALLTRTPVGFRYSAANAELQAERPIIQLSCRGVVAAVHYNSRSIAPVRLPPADMGPFYAAYRQFAALLRRAKFQAICHLASGELVVFDNQRILHGRTRFVSARHPRHLRGCYLTRDSVYGTAALLQREILGEPDL